MPTLAYGEHIAAKYCDGDRVKLSRIEAVPTFSDVSLALTLVTGFSASGPQT